MSKNNEESKLTKVEIQRQERKERLESQKGRNGKKKSIQVKKKKSWFLPTTIIILVLAVIAWFLNGYGIAERYLNAFSVDGENVKVLEYNYYYNDILNSYKNYVSSSGMPDFNLDDQYPYGEDKEEVQTWREMIENQTEKTIQHVKLLAKEAKEANFKLDDKDLEQSEKFIDSLIEQQGSKSSLNSFLRKTYGKGFNIFDLTKLDREQRLALKYQNNKISNIEIPDDEINKYYEEHKDEYDKVNYNIARIRVDASKFETESNTEQSESTENLTEIVENSELNTTESTTEEMSNTSEESKNTSKEDNKSSESLDSSISNEVEKSSEESTSLTDETTIETIETTSSTESEADLKAKNQMNEVADRIENGLKAGGNFETLVMQDSDSVENAELAADGTSRLKQSSYKYAIYPQSIADWLFDKDRKNGDYYRLEENGTIYIVQFESREADKRESSEILIRTVPATEFDKLDKDLQQSIKEQLVKDFDSQVTDEESFEGFSIDGLTIDSSNEIKLVREGVLSNSVVNTVLSDNTKVGDHKLIEEYGNYYLIFVKARGPLKVYQQDIKTKLQSDKYKEELDEKLNSLEKIDYNPLAKLFIAK